MKPSTHLRHNAHGWRSLATGFGLAARVLQAQTRANLEAWKTLEVQKKLELNELNIAYRANQILLQDLAIEEKKRNLGLAAAAFTPANYVTTGTAPVQPRAPGLHVGSTLVAPTGRWTVEALDAATITVGDGLNSYTYPTSAVVTDLRRGRIQLEG